MNTQCVIFFPLHYSSDSNRKNKQQRKTQKREKRHDFTLNAPPSNMLVEARTPSCSTNQLQQLKQKRSKKKNSHHHHNNNTKSTLCESLRSVKSCNLWKLFKYNNYRIFWDNVEKKTHYMFFFLVKRYEIIKHYEKRKELSQKERGKKLPWNGELKKREKRRGLEKIIIKHTTAVLQTGTPFYPTTASLPLPFFFFFLLPISCHQSSIGCQSTEEDFSTNQKGTSWLTQLAPKTGTHMICLIRQRMKKNEQKKLSTAASIQQRGKKQLPRLPCLE